MVTCFLQGLESCLSLHLLLWFGHVSLLYSMSDSHCFVNPRNTLSHGKGWRQKEEVSISVNWWTICLNKFAICWMWYPWSKTGYDCAFASKNNSCCWLWFIKPLWIESWLLFLVFFFLSFFLFTLCLNYLLTGKQKLLGFIVDLVDVH